MQNHFERSLFVTKFFILQPKHFPRALRSDREATTFPWSANQNHFFPNFCMVLFSGSYQPCSSVLIWLLSWIFCVFHKIQGVQIKLSISFAIAQFDCHMKIRNVGHLVKICIHWFMVPSEVYCLYGVVYITELFHSIIMQHPVSFLLASLTSQAERRFWWLERRTSAEISYFLQDMMRRNFLFCSRMKQLPLVDVAKDCENTRQRWGS